MAINGINAPITRPQELARLAGALQREPVVAVDTESNSLFAYQERVCLIQFSTRQEDYLVDPLALTDLSVLAPLFANPQIEKVFHAAEYDLLCMKRDFGFDFANLFDTMLAARILKRKAVGLGSILEEEFGVSADKRQQRANWGERPLRPHLLDYARMDTHYLIPLRERMGAELEARGMGALAREDFRRLCQVDAHITENGREPAWRVSGVHTLSPKQAAVLNELCNYREHVARAIDRPLFKVIGDKTLVAIAEAQPGSLDELEGLPGMTPRQIQRHGKHILQAVQRGKQAKPLHPPPRSALPGAPGCAAPMAQGEGKEDGRGIRYRLAAGCGVCAG
jgi:ribonuclease D